MAALRRWLKRQRRLWHSVRGWHDWRATRVLAKRAGLLGPVTFIRLECDCGETRSFEERGA